MSLLLPFNSSEVQLQNAGGKGANLARLTRAGFNVPHGFILSTEAYSAYVAANNLTETIHAAVANLFAEDAAQLENASAQIRAAFVAGTMPVEIEGALRSAYAAFSQAPVAVRSSATTEDLPDLSFAGQQDTYLNVVGAEAVLAAAINCWGSLWTARAIGYRMRNHISHAEAALAVVVQKLVASEVSGVLFTANPVTGLLSESVIDATFGLGEALVSGQVEPDHFVADSASGAIVMVTLGSKHVATRGLAGGGVESVAENSAARQTLSAAQVRHMVAAGQAIQQEYGAPQDIEWAWAGEELCILQARAITSLFPVPHISFEPLTVWFSFGAVQGLVGPLTPLGRDGIVHVAAGAGRMFGVHQTPQTQTLFAPAGERIWVRISDLLRHPVGARLYAEILPLVEPSVGQILVELAKDPRLGVGTGKLKIDTVRRLAGFALPIVMRLLRNLLWPEDVRARFDADIESYLSAATIAPGKNRFERLANVAAFLRARVGGVFAFLLPKFIPIFGPGMAGLNVLMHFTGDRALALAVTRGLPRNVTTEMDLALWATAQTIKANEAARTTFQNSPAAELAEHYLNGALPPAAQAALTQFLARYGMRGVGEIDFGQPRWHENPTPVIHTLQSYLNIPEDSAPDVLFAKGGRAALAAVEKIAATVRAQTGGWLKEKMVRAAARRVRLLMGARESPKFFAIRTMGVARQALLEAGQEFVAAGTLARADDLSFLTLAELEALAHNSSAQDWRALVASRRATHEREARRRLVPRVLVSDGRAFYEGVGAATDTGDVISGSPVSPGVVEGVVHVVIDPRGTHLAPGEILVCPGTDPAWTPLFMAAGGLVMEVGGMMTHGSVVAREYGIPAVVGVHQATLRLKNGQRIRVDGTQGKVSVLAGDE
ncbi:MAG: hypothetical protein JNL09_09220 [Anaerolineales bacterium]|nr:hypothetical protein [Anaerolineales bacterium]